MTDVKLGPELEAVKAAMEEREGQPVSVEDVLRFCVRRTQATIDGTFTAQTGAILRTESQSLMNDILDGLVEHGFMVEPCRVEVEPQGAAVLRKTGGRAPLFVVRRRVLN